MKQSQLITKTRKAAPKDEVSKNAQLLIRAGFIHKEMAGVYAFLPLGLRVLENIKQIVREEMNALGSQEIIMTSLQQKELWDKTDRWDDKKVDVWFKSKLKNGTEVGLGWSHEEPITNMIREHVDSYRDLPAYVYQFQNKLRNELRAKSGILRGREFLMKDLYSYTTDEKAHEIFYNSVITAYHKIFTRVGIGDRTFLTFASGGAFTQFSHEFQTLSDAGEDTIYLDRKKNIAINKEVYTKDVMKQLGVEEKNLEKVTSIETGNIFSFGVEKSKELGLSFTAKTGEEKFVTLGSYGIGITRLMGTVVETLSDEKGIVWPATIAPFSAHIIAIGDDKILKKAEGIYNDLQNNGFDVLLDDRDDSPGSKLKDADLIGIPMRIVISEKSLPKIEIKERKNEEPELITIGDLLKRMKELDV